MCSCMTPSSDFHVLIGYMGESVARCPPAAGRIQHIHFMVDRVSKLTDGETPWDPGYHGPMGIEHRPYMIDHRVDHAEHVP